MRIVDTPWFAVPVGSRVLDRAGRWHTLRERGSAEEITCCCATYHVQPSSVVPVAVPDLIDILAMFTSAGLAPVPLAIDVPTEHLDAITKRSEIKWLSQRHR